ncbi:type A2 lanthipeptide [Streptomyces sp. NPDC053427]|uniref:type A2 lanthipeptide n=1 Tax=Streptomyces sp. NPDC053427 TaxID=3365701 RepID=UPI0037D31184
MREIQTQEIADSELDNVAGGLVGGLVGTVTTTADSIAPVSGVVNTATGLVEQTAGVNTAGVTGLVAGL